MGVFIYLLAGLLFKYFLLRCFLTEDDDCEVEVISGIGKTDVFVVLWWLPIFVLLIFVVFCVWRIRNLDKKYGEFAVK